MKLKIAAVNHNDILGPRRLFEWFSALKECEDSSPEFVAVEYDEKLFLQIKVQRPLMRKLASEAWSDASPEILTLLEESLVYEGDLHTSVFPGVETLWLDHDRVVFDPLAAYAKDRMNIYLGLLPEAPRTKVGIEDINNMCIVAWANSNLPQPGGTERDERFANVILQRSSRSIKGWSIVIVGASHAADIPGTMVSRLKQQGISCDVTELRPSP